jgi:hypothetical protein
MAVMDIAGIETDGGRLRRSFDHSARARAMAE